MAMLLIRLLAGSSSRNTGEPSLINPSQNSDSGHLRSQTRTRFGAGEYSEEASRVHDILRQRQETHASSLQNDASSENDSRLEKTSSG